MEDKSILEEPNTPAETVRKPVWASWALAVVTLLAAISLYLVERSTPGRIISIILLAASLSAFVSAVLSALNALGVQDEYVPSDYRMPIQYISGAGQITTVAYAFANFIIGIGDVSTSSDVAAAWAIGGIIVMVLAFYDMRSTLHVARVYAESKRLKLQQAAESSYRKSHPGSPSQGPWT